MNIPLTELPPNKIAQVVKMNNSGPEQARLVSMGLLVGTRIEVIQSNYDGAILVAIGTLRLGIGNSLAKQIVVKIKKLPNTN